MNTMTLQLPLVDSCARVGAQMASVAEKRIERGGVMIERVSVVSPYPFTAGSARCQCGRCGFVFSAITNFDAHQTLDDAGAVQCWEPASLGMVCRDGVWGRPGDSTRVFDRSAVAGRASKQREPTMRRRRNCLVSTPS